MPDQVKKPLSNSLSLEDIQNTEIQAVLSGVSEHGYWPRWEALSNAAKEAEQNGQETAYSALTLLAHACSMALQPNSWNEPLTASVRLRTGRSAELVDFSDEEINLLADASNNFEDPWVRARLAEIAWLRKEPRDISYVKTALSAYQEIPINLKTFLRDGAQTWARALNLAKRLGKPTKDYLKSFEETLVEALLQTQSEEGFLALWIADLLKGFGLGNPKRKPIANHLESLAILLGNEGDFHKNREYLLKAAEWFQEMKEDVKSAELITLAAESYVNQATPSTGKPNVIPAMFWLEKAIHLYRSIPKEYRNPNRVEELKKILEDVNKEVLEELIEVRTDQVDITKLVQTARESVIGKTPLEGLLTLANIASLTDVKVLRQASVQNLSRFPSFGTSTTMSTDGRAVQKQPSLDPAQPFSEQEQHIQAEMLKDYRIHIELTCGARILPALESMQLEHRITEDDFIELAKKSPLVPQNRSRQFGKALYFGYDWDFGTSIQLLCPQVENMIRSHLKSASAVTTNFDLQGIQTETSLNTLIDLPLAPKVLGESLAFEIKNLFCEPGGPNLRNQVGHGLLNDDQICSYPSVYAWWLILRLVINSAWNTSYCDFSSEAQKENDSPDKL